MSLPPFRIPAEGAPSLESSMASALPSQAPVMQREEIISTILQMGISREDAELAVQQTGGNSVEAAISWVFENGDSVSDAQMEEAGNIYQEYKMVFVVNDSLEMSAGKIAAQVAHAAVDLYTRLISSQEEEFGAGLLQWNENGSKKVALRGENTEQLKELARKADLLGLPNSIIIDVGRTEIPRGSQTVLGIFGMSDKVDEVTGRLKLL